MKAIRRYYRQDGFRPPTGRMGRLTWLLAVVLVAMLAAGCQPVAVVEIQPPTPAAATESPVPTATAAPPASPTPRPPLPATSVTGVAATVTATATPLPSPTSTAAPIRFAVIGDYGLAAEPAADVAALVDGWEVEFIITTGDNNYPSGEASTIDENIGQYYHEYIFPYLGEYGPGAVENRFFPSPGNHDWESDELEPYLEYFVLPGNERYYEFAAGPVHFFALNSDPKEPDGVSQDWAQAQWLEQALAAAEAPWKIVYMHVPPYSSGIHRSGEWMRWPYEAWGASAVLSGHNHVYERVVLDGFPYFTNGLGGYPSRYPFVGSVGGSEARFNDDYGAMLVEASPSEITFQFITRAGVLIDSYTLTQ